MAQQVKNLNSVHEDVVWSLVLLSGLRIWPCQKLQHKTQRQLGSGIAVAVATAAVALMWPLSWELPNAMGVALKKKDQKKKYIYIYMSISSDNSLEFTKMIDSLFLNVRNNRINAGISGRKSRKYEIYKYSLYHPCFYFFKNFKQ